MCRELILGLQGILDRIKGFTCGTYSRSEDKMIIDYQDKRYLISVKEIKEPHNDMIKDIYKYLE